MRIPRLTTFNYLLCFMLIFISASIRNVSASTVSAGQLPGAGAGFGNSDAAQVLSLWPVSGAAPGITVKLWAQVKNAGGSAWSSEAKVWFWVDGPNWTATHWVGGASIPALAPNEDQWYSLDWTVPADAPAGNYIYWAQVWTNLAISEWSSGQTFVVFKDPAPGQATLILPKGVIASSTPKYVWTSVKTATWYYLWVNDSSASSGKIRKWYTAAEAGCGSGIGDCSVIPSEVLAPGAAQWWIQTWNAAGYGPWSDAAAFTITRSLPPGKASLVYPSDVISNPSPSYIWHSASTATRYQLLVKHSNGATRVQQWYTADQAQCYEESAMCAITPALTLSPGTYQWWIQTSNSGGDGPWSDTMSFTFSSGTFPGKASLLSPFGNIATEKPSYAWEALRTASWYFLWVNDSTTGSGKIKTWYSAAQAGCVSGIGTCSVTPDVAIAAGDAKWWIQTWNESGGYGPWSDGMAFKVTKGLPPEKAVLLYPLGTITTTTPPYLWKPVWTASRYYLWVQDSRGTVRIQQWLTADQAQCFEETLTCAVKPAINLAPGTYQWWIQTSNNSGDGPWSSPLEFTISAAGSPTEIAEHFEARKSVPVQ